MFQSNREARLPELLSDPIIQTLMKADKVDALKLEAMLLRIADDLKSRNDASLSICPLDRMLSFLKAH